MSEQSETPSKYAELIAHLEAVGWKAGKDGDAECVDEGAARAADTIKCLERELFELTRELEALRKALKKHHDGNHFLENSPPNCYKCGLAFAALTPPKK